jgi:hypothetical protein
MAVTTTSPRLRRNTARSRSSCSSRAEPRLRGLRVERPLRAAGLAQELGVTTCATPTTTRAAGGHLPPALRPRPQPLRALHAVRAGVRRDRGRLRVGRRRARHPVALVSELDRPWGEARDLHELRQVRAGLPHRRAGREGLRGRGDDQARIWWWPPDRGMREGTMMAPKARLATVLAGRLLRLPHVAARRGRGLLDPRSTKADIVFGPLVDAQEFPGGRRRGARRGRGQQPGRPESSPSRHPRAQQGRGRLGDCAVTSNVPLHAQRHPREAALERIYVEGATRPRRAHRRRAASCCAGHAAARGGQGGLHVPGCPPKPNAIAHVLTSCWRAASPTSARRGSKFG